jgi:hypothetical protein
LIVGPEPATAWSTKARAAGLAAGGSVVLNADWTAATTPLAGIITAPSATKATTQPINATYSTLLWPVLIRIRAACADEWARRRVMTRGFNAMCALAQIKTDDSCPLNHQIGMDSDAPITARMVLGLALRYGRQEQTIVIIRKCIKHR